MVSRHITRGLGTKIAKRVKLSPVVMESTHDLDFVFWLLEPAKPVRVYSQGAYGYMQPINGSYDIMWTIVTMDNGMLVAIGGGWNLPPSYPNYCSTWVEITGTEGALILDDTHRDNWLNTVAEGTPVSDVDHAGRAGRPRVRRPDGAGDHPLPRSLHPRPAGDGDAGERAHGDGDLHRGRPLGRAQRAGRPAAVERVAVARSPRWWERDADEKAGQGHRARHHRRRPGRVVSRRGGGAPSGGAVDRHRREEPQPRPLRAPRRSAPTSSPPTIASCSSGRRSPARSSPPTSTCTSIRSWRRSSAACRC